MRKTLFWLGVVAAGAAVAYYIAQQEKELAELRAFKAEIEAEKAREAAEKAKHKDELIDVWLSLDYVNRTSGTCDPVDRAIKEAERKADRLERGTAEVEFDEEWVRDLKRVARERNIEHMLPPEYQDESEDFGEQTT